ncbi:hypothetical protein MMC25_003589 [Agyrium rufum]|nr:hypothetical protein [Agyrium rufum]
MSETQDHRWSSAIPIKFASLEEKSNICTYGGATQSTELRDQTWDADTPIRFSFRSRNETWNPRQGIRFASTTRTEISTVRRRYMSSTAFSAAASLRTRTSTDIKDLLGSKTSKQSLPPVPKLKLNLPPLNKLPKPITIKVSFSESHNVLAAEAPRSSAGNTKALSPVLLSKKEKEEKLTKAAEIILTRRKNASSADPALAQAKPESLGGSTIHSEVRKLAKTLAVPENPRATPITSLELFKALKSGSPPSDELAFSLSKAVQFEGPISVRPFRETHLVDFGLVNPKKPTSKRPRRVQRAPTTVAVRTKYRPNETIDHNQAPLSVGHTKYLEQTWPEYPYGSSDASLDQDFTGNKYAWIDIASDNSLLSAKSSNASDHIISPSYAGGLTESEKYCDWLNIERQNFVGYDAHVRSKSIFRSNIKAMNNLQREISMEYTRLLRPGLRAYIERMDHMLRRGLREIEILGHYVREIKWLGGRMRQTRLMLFEEQLLESDFVRTHYLRHKFVSYLEASALFVSDLFARSTENPGLEKAREWPDGRNFRVRVYALLHRQREIHTMINSHLVSDPRLCVRTNERVTKYEALSRRVRNSQRELLASIQHLLDQYRDSPHFHTPAWLDTLPEMDPSLKHVCLCRSNLWARAYNFGEYHHPQRYVVRMLRELDKLAYLLLAGPELKAIYNSPFKDKLSILKLGPLVYLDRPGRLQMEDRQVEHSQESDVRSESKPEALRRSANLIRRTLSAIDDDSLQVGKNSHNVDLAVQHHSSTHLISKNSLFRAHKAAPGSPGSFWRYSMYRDVKGDPPIVHYCKSLVSAEHVLKTHFLEKKKRYGFDLEWKPSAGSGDGIRKAVSLIQLASPNHIALIHIAQFEGGDTIKDLLPPSFKELMQSSEITKMGVNIKGDCTRLKKSMGIKSQGLFELSHLYKLVKYSKEDTAKEINKRLVALAIQVQEHLHLPLDKGNYVRGSDWSYPADLTNSQIEYAASDSYAAVQLFIEMDAKRLALDPVPPLPAFAELNLPIELASGVKVDTSENGVTDSANNMIGTDGEDESVDEMAQQFIQLATGEK